MGVTRYGDAGPGPKGSVMIAAFELEGQRFTALNGGPHFKFTEAVSFVVNCETQEEVDHFWDKLGEGGQIQQCGWLKDKFGLSWQTIPTTLPELMSDPDPEKVRRVTEAMLQMTKRQSRRPENPDSIDRRPRGPDTAEEQMTLHMTRTDEKTEIRDLLDDWAKAARAGDLEGVMAAYAPDILAFDAIAQLQFKGAEAYRKHWQMCVEMCSGPTTFEIHDLGIEAEGGVAFAHYLLRCGGTGPDGKEQTGWMRVTAGCRKMGGRWLIAHEHFSAPFDMESGKALLGLEP